jgi:hypothetical protein
MAEHKRVPNIEALDEREAYSFLTDVFFYGPIPDPEVVYQANHPDDYAMEMPQSGERIVGRENMRRFHNAYPGSPTIRVRRVWSGMGCGWWRGSTTTGRAGIRYGDDHRAQRWQDLARQALLCRAV